jgi:dTDP-4-dehydrorhamnose 3,5-epimerase-like enzyme
LWNDAVIGINWPIWKISGMPVISEKDANAVLFKEIK